MASIAQPSSPSKSKTTSIISPTFTKSSSRVFIDVSVPRHRGRRLSLEEVDPDASKALKISSKPSVKLAKKDGKASDASSRALKPTTRTNSFTGIKRGREDEKDEKEGAKKRKVDIDGKIHVSYWSKVGWTLPSMFTQMLISSSRSLMQIKRMKVSLKAVHFHRRKSWTPPRWRLYVTFDILHGSS